MDDLVAQFMAVTDAPIRKAESYMRVSDGNLQQALQLFFETGGADMEDPPSSSTPAPPVPSRTSRPGGNDEPTEIDDDMEDDDLREALRASEGVSDAATRAPAGAPTGTGGGTSSEYDDEALARQLQEELYGGGGSGGGAGEGIEVRAPIARTRETLVDDEYTYPDPTRHASRRRGAPASRGIFNQRSTSVWDESEASSAERRYRFLADATGGASESSSKSVRLAEMYRPPFEIISQLSLEDARAEAREDEKWILVNVQDNSFFACQTLNRDIWKATEVMATVKENFLFLQMDRNGMDGRDYIRYYLQKAADPSARYDSTVADLFPHIAIIDPRTGEQVKVWKTVPKEPMDFVMQLHEFLERYSLDVGAKNPVQRTSKVKPTVADMTEDEMMQLAMQNSLGAATSASTSDDPDALTKDTPDSDLMDFEESSKGKQPAAIEVEDETPFSRIRANAHHAEPPPGPETTRIQFKMHDGTRVVRRFLLKDRVERLFEYVKADMLPEHEAKKPEEERRATPGEKEFDLVCLGKNLIEFLDMTVDEAGLKNGTVMVGVMDD